MHIDVNKLGTSLLPEEHKHLVNCESCRQQHEQLLLLREQAKNMEMLTPPTSVWFNIVKHKTQQKKERNIQYRYVSLAVSVVVSVLGILMFNNYKLQQQVEQVLQVNQSLELQLIQNTLPTFQQAKMLSRVREIEQQLVHARSQKEKLRLLKQRQQIISKLVQSQGKGEDHVFKI